MALSGEAKRDYQRNYMRRRRAHKRQERDIMTKMDYAKAAARSVGLRGWQADREEKRISKILEEGLATDSRRGYEYLLELAKERGYASGWAAHRFHTMFGHWPPRITK